MVIDELLENLPSDMGFDISGTRINALAFADDLVLITSSARGMQIMLDISATQLAQFGLALNIEKSSVISLVPSGREKKMKVLSESIFNINDINLKQTAVTNTWKYFGINFAATGKQTCRNALELLLARLMKAPLKPQQRMMMLRQFVIPRLLYPLTVGRANMGNLKQMGTKIRGFVRATMKLPKDAALGIFHAPVADGGLGVMSLARHVPMMRLNRIERMSNSDSSAVRAATTSNIV